MDKVHKSSDSETMLPASAVLSDCKAQQDGFEAESFCLSLTDPTYQSTVMQALFRNKQKAKFPCSQLIKHHAINSNGEWRYSFSIVHLGTRQRWMVSFTPRPLYAWWKSPPYTMEWKLYEPQCRYGRLAREKSALRIPITKPLSPGFISYVSQYCILSKQTYFH
jgi:hypothetical protein